ncbi:hypothetical protein J3L18_30990 [Mucilaginibacter gossypii]|uniref:hypothetical protein n=1 Tax=Mucilaginibacter gossypii TaxID=551996 RepID=UPI000DCD1C6F|nr:MULTISPECIES: hypothetical protein [Mucilaginibacter]QTE37474.1 hypothetical protein J3L18_30990 [Mucilaginibacter gossypii]RAV52300.1 hypothetical protein DIU36_24505 [Mucilaginibacter rubeus]
MATTLINGINYSWANVTLILFGVPVVGITKISYKRKQKKENNYGMGAQPVSRGYGNYEYEGSIELYQDEWQRIIAASPNRDPFQIAPFDIPIVFDGSRIQPEKHVLRSVEFMEDGFDASQGDTKLMITVPLVIGGIEK